MKGAFIIVCFLFSQDEAHATFDHDVVKITLECIAGVRVLQTVWGSRCTLKQKETINVGKSRKRGDKRRSKFGLGENRAPCLIR